MICGNKNRPSGATAINTPARVADTAWTACTPSSANVYVRVREGRVEFKGTLSAPGTSGNTAFVAVATLPAGIPKPTTTTSLPVACFRSGPSVPYTVGIIKITPIGTSGTIALCPAGGLTDGCYLDGISYPVEA